LALATFGIAVALASCAKVPDAAKTTLPLNPNPVFAPIAFSEDEDMPFPGIEGFEAKESYITLVEAIYSINYSRSQYPEYEREHGILARIDTFTGASATATTAFGNGEPAEEWILDRSLRPFTQGESRPAWDITAVDLDSEAQIPQHLLVDAETGDVFIDSNSGGYFPSPYLSRSKYGQVAATPLAAGGLTEDVAQNLLSTLNYDLWSAHYSMEPIDLSDYIADNPKNRFVLDWGNTRMERSEQNAGLKLVSEPDVQKIAITSMQALDDGTVRVKYQSFVQFELEDSPNTGIGSDQIVLFEKGRNQWILADIGCFPWMLDDYYDEYYRQYGETSR